MSGNGKVAIITGASAGIGRGAAVALLEEGYNVALSGRRAAMLEETAAMAKGGGKALVVPSDVTDVEQVRDLFDRTVAEFGRLDVLFNNAGMGAPPVDIDELPIEKWLEVVNVNLTGVFLCTREAFRVMKAQTPMGGRIINNGSISAHAPRPNSSPYTSTKHGVTGLTKCTSLDGRKYDIACGQIDIGNAETPLAARMADGVPQADGSVRPEPLMHVDNVSRAIVYMASLPPDANVQFLTVMATKMPFVGRG